MVGGAAADDAAADDDDPGLGWKLTHESSCWVRCRRVAAQPRRPPASRQRCVLEMDLAAVLNASCESDVSDAVNPVKVDLSGRAGRGKRLTRFSDI
jgi:hypothetical protein